MKIALIQMNSGGNKAANVRKAVMFVQKALAKGARFILLPEYFYFRGKIKGAKTLRKVAESVDGPTVSLFAGMARAKRAYILLGSIYERIPGDVKVYDTSVLIGPQGGVVAAYRKKHLFHVQLFGREIQEGRVLKPGKRLRMARVSDFFLGMGICFDVRFSDMFERYARRGANAMSLPSAFTSATGEAHWESLLRSRAIETLSYVLAPNQVGCGGDGIRCWGHSMVVSPWGEVVAEASGQKEETVYAVLDRKALVRARTAFFKYKKI